jgi:hypothetical protein
MSFSKFYPVNPIKPTPYPHEKESLYFRLLSESTKTPLKFGLEYFQTYINNGGKRIHPILGDLANFVNDVEKQWDKAKGVNFVVGFLKSNLDLEAKITTDITPQ